MPPYAPLLAAKGIDAKHLSKSLEWFLNKGNFLTRRENLTANCAKVIIYYCANDRETFERKSRRARTHQMNV